MYINLTTLTRCTESEIRSANPNTSFSVPFTPPEGYAVLFNAPVPTYDPMTQGYREVTPQQVEEQWYTAYEVFDLTPEQIAANQAAAAQALQDSIVQAVQQRLDDFARTRNYDDIKSAVTYAGCSVPKFATEGEYCRDKRAETWATLYQVLAEVQAGTRPVPTGYSDVEPLLPVLEWPA